MVGDSAPDICPLTRSPLPSSLDIRPWARQPLLIAPVNCIRPERRKPEPVKPPEPGKIIGNLEIGRNVERRSAKAPLVGSVTGTAPQRRRASTRPLGCQDLAATPPRLPHGPLSLKNTPPSGVLPMSHRARICPASTMSHFQISVTSPRYDFMSHCARIWPASTMSQMSHFPATKTRF